MALLVFVMALAVWRIRAGGPGGAAAVKLGTPLPALTGVDGWLNLADGESFDPTGELLVVDCWATWCPPCRADLPRMAFLAARYRPLGVKFLGVTQETARDLPKIQDLIAEISGFDWPVAYGASEFVRPLNFQYIPTVILFGRDGRVAWSGNSSDGLERALDEALAASGQTS